MGLCSDFPRTTVSISPARGVELMLHRAPWLLPPALLLLIVTPQTLHARDGDQVHIGQSITVGQNENVGDLVCIGCSIEVAGRSGGVVAIGGSIMVGGTVKGTVV